MNWNWGLICGTVLVSITALCAGFGCYISCSAAVGAWKKCFLNNKPAPMMLLAFIANPVTQIFYAYILQGRILAAAEANPDRMVIYVGLTITSLVTLGVTSIMQGKVAAFCCDAMVETRKGFAQNMAAMGVLETTALFTMVFGVTIL